MIKNIKMWRELGPRLAPAPAMEAEEIIEQVVATTNQTRGSILAALAELDTAIERALKAGRRVKMPNGMVYRPVGKKDGSIDVKVYVSPRMEKSVNAEKRARWINAENVGKSEAEMIAIWNELHPDDPIEA
jgi:hypothetical protein